MVHLTLVALPNCPSCQRVLQQVESVCKAYPHTSLVVCSSHPHFHTAIVPALFIENDLFAYGEINQERLLSEIKRHDTEKL